MRKLAIIAILLAADNTITVAALGVMGLVIPSVVGWLIARRSTSGGIEKSASGELWEASDRLRKDLADALQSAYLRETQLRERMTRQEQVIEAQGKRISDLEAEVAMLLKGIPG